MKKQLRNKPLRKRPARETPSVCSILGVTQLEAAVLVGVHRSQWSMFESGKRSLPAAAELRLAPLLQAAQADDVSAKATAVHDRHHSEREQLLHKLLVENTYQLETIKRQIAREQSAEDANKRRQRVANCLNAQSHPMRETISYKAEQALAKFNARLLKLEIKVELLEFEKNLIQSKLGKSNAEPATLEIKI